MRSLGTYLRQLRESRGASLADIARSTRVGKRHLEALEEGAFSELPAPVFVKGFLRSYCEFLGVPPEEALARYREDLGEAAAVAAPRSPPRRPRRGKGPIALSLLLFWVLGVALLAVSVGLRDKSAPPPEPAVAVAQPGAALAPAGSAARPGPSPGATTAPRPADPGAGSQAPAPPSLASASGQRLVVKAVEPTWIRVQADEGQVTQELLPVGATREWTADQRFVLTVGNAGGIEVELNGRRIPRLGASGSVIQRLVLPPDQGAPRS
jgi:cytoskeleton protein RodZ